MRRREGCEFGLTQRDESLVMNAERVRVKWFVGCQRENKILPKKKKKIFVEWENEIKKRGNKILPKKRRHREKSEIENNFIKL